MAISKLLKELEQLTKDLLQLQEELDDIRESRKLEEGETAMN